MARDHLWRGLHLRKVIAADLQLKNQNSADVALSTYFEVVERKARARESYHDALSSNPNAKVPPIVYLSLWPAGQELRGALCSGNFKRTSADLYDDFSRYFMGFPKVAPDKREQYSSRLELSHPTRPNPFPSKKYLETRLGTIEDARKHLPPTQRALRGAWEVINLTTKLLKEVGLSDEARQLLDRMTESLSKFRTIA